MEGSYTARPDNEATLTIENICAALKNRGGFTGSYDDLVKHVHQFLDEAIYQLCNGFTINQGRFSIHINIGGTLDTATERHDADKNPITIHSDANPAATKVP